MTLHPNDLAHLGMTQRDWDQLPAEWTLNDEFKRPVMVALLVVLWLLLVGVLAAIAYFYFTRASEPVSAAQPAVAWAKHGGEGVSK